MLFGKKINRVVNVREAAARFEEERAQVPLEKNDRLAMILAALVVFVPVFLVIVAILLLVFFLFFFRHL